MQYPEVSALEPHSAQPRWETEVLDGVELPATVDDGTLSFATRDGHVYAIDIANGNVRWRQRTVTRLSYVAVSGRSLWLSDGEGILYAYARPERTPVFESDAYAGSGGAVERVNPIATTPDGIFVGGTSRVLYSMH